MLMPDGFSQSASPGLSEYARNFVKNPKIYRYQPIPLIHSGNAGGFLQTKFEGNPIMGNTIEIAASSNLVGSYHAMFDGILNSTAGQLITKVGAAAAVILALGLILGGISKLLGRTNRLVAMFCPSAARIVVVLVVIFIFAGPTVTVPTLLTALDWIVNAVGNQSKDYFGV